MASSKPKVLVDINIFVDVFQKRQGWNNSLAIIEKIRGKEIQGYISALTVPILYFQRLRISREKDARNEVWEMVKGFKIIDLNEAILRNALDDSKFRDYEDSIQYQSADLECDAIITRNKKDFPHKKPKVLTPEEFLNSYKL